MPNKQTFLENQYYIYGLLGQYSNMPNWIMRTKDVSLVSSSIDNSILLWDVKTEYKI